MKRGGFKPKAYERAPAAPLKPLTRAVVVAQISDTATPIEKDGTFRSEAWRRAVASLPCCWCFKAGPSQCAHANHRSKGMAMKAPDCWSFPLCPEHHAEFDQGRTLTKDQRRQMADEWILVTLLALAQKGLVKA